MRLCQEALPQTALLTVEDPAMLLGCNGKTVGLDVASLHREHGILVPNLAHKRIICTRHLREGRSVQQTALETDHSPAAIIRYVQDFRRVYVCRWDGWELARIVQATGLSKPLVRQYADMIQEDGTVAFDEVPF